MKKYLVVEHTGQTVDPDTGEVVQYSERKEVVKKEFEPFFLTYSKQILALYDSNVLNATTKVLYKMLEFSEWNSGKVYMTSDRVEEIMQVCGLSRASYHRAVKELIDIGIIIKGKGSYTIAEDMFWKGELKMRDQVREARLKIGFSPVFENEIEGEEEVETNA